MCSPVKTLIRVRRRAQIFDSANLQSEINGALIRIRTRRGETGDEHRRLSPWRSDRGETRWLLSSLPRRSDRCEIQELLFEPDLAEVARAVCQLL